MDIREIVADSRETGIYWSEIATYSQEIVADAQEMAANIGETGIDTGRTATRSRGMAANLPFPAISAGFAQNNLEIRRGRVVVEPAPA